MNILFKCFACGEEAKIEIHSYSWNKEKESFEIKKLCQDFSNIELNWKTKYGFFTLGWSVNIYNVSLKCEGEKCHKRITFASKTFDKYNNDYEEIQECCNKIIVYSAREGKFGCSDEGRRRQNKIKQFIEELKKAEEENKKLKEEQEQLEKEEKLWKQKEEEERKEREEEEKKQKEKEQRRRNQYEQENKEMLEIEKQQEKENKELNKKINIGASWIEEQMSQMISETNANISRNISICNVGKTIKANTQFQVGK